MATATLQQQPSAPISPLSPQQLHQPHKNGSFGSDTSDGEDEGSCSDGGSGGRRTESPQAPLISTDGDARVLAIVAGGAPFALASPFARLDYSRGPALAVRYAVLLATPDAFFVVERRYSDIVEFHRRLREAFNAATPALRRFFGGVDGVPALPSRRVSAQRTNSSVGEVIVRRSALNRYFREVGQRRDSLFAASPEAQRCLASLLLGSCVGIGGMAVPTTAMPMNSEGSVNGVSFAPTGDPGLLGYAPERPDGTLGLGADGAVRGDDSSERECSPEPLVTHRFCLPPSALRARQTQWLRSATASGGGQYCVPAEHPRRAAAAAAQAAAAPLLAARFSAAAAAAAAAAVAIVVSDNSGNGAAAAGASPPLRSSPSVARELSFGPGTPELRVSPPPVVSPDTKSESNLVPRACGSTDSPPSVKAALQGSGSSEPGLSSGEAGSGGSGLEFGTELTVMAPVVAPPAPSAPAIATRTVRDGAWGALPSLLLTLPGAWMVLDFETGAVEVRVRGAESEPRAVVVSRFHALVALYEGIADGGDRLPEPPGAQAILLRHASAAAAAAAAAEAAAVDAAPSLTGALPPPTPRPVNQPAVLFSAAAAILTRGRTSPAPAAGNHASALLPPAAVDGGTTSIGGSSGSSASSGGFHIKQESRKRVTCESPAKLAMRQRCRNSSHWLCLPASSEGDSDSDGQRSSNADLASGDEAALGRRGDIEAGEVVTRARGCRCTHHQLCTPAEAAAGAAAAPPSLSLLTSPTGKVFATSEVLPTTRYTFRGGGSISVYPPSGGDPDSRNLS